MSHHTQSGIEVPQRPAYECAVCGRGVLVRESERPVRACEHVDAAIYANMQAVVSQDGGVAP